mgnify:CR=1 FL=1
MTEERKLLREALESLQGGLEDGGDLETEYSKHDRDLCNRISALLATEPEPVALKEKGRARNGAEWQEPSELVSTRNELQSTRSAEVPEKILAGWYDLDYEVSWGETKPTITGTWKPLYIERALPEDKK